VKSSDLEQISLAGQLTGDDAISAYRKILSSDESSENALKAKEQSIYKLGELYAIKGDVENILALLRDIRPFFQTIPKSKTAKIVRSIIKMLEHVSNATDLQIDVCNECITWCEEEKRNFLRQRIQVRLAALLLEKESYQAALSLVKTVSYEVKKLDDKQLLVEIYLIESRLYHAIGNLPKSSAALTSARTAANAIYVPPAQQAEIDLQAGLLYSDSKDYRTSFSYFFEAFENYANLAQAGLRARRVKLSAAQGSTEGGSVISSGVTAHHDAAVRSFKYMLLCKIMQNLSSDVTALINGKHGLRFACEDLEAMGAIASSECPFSQSI
jgi:26S proteasome regulatory subunit N6